MAYLLLALMVLLALGLSMVCYGFALESRKLAADRLGYYRSRAQRRR